MTNDDALAAALRDLAGTVTDEPGRLAQVHLRARRLRRRRRAAGAGVLAATLAAGLVGAQEIGGSGPGPRLATPATSPAAGVPACQIVAASSPGPGATTPPAVGEQFGGGGVVVGTPGPASVTVDVQGGPLAGSRLTLGVTSGTGVFVASPDSTADTPVSAAQLRAGQVVKFTATRTGAQTFVADQIHAAPLGAATAGTASTAGAGAGSAAGTGSTGGPNTAGPRTGGAGPGAAAKIAGAPQPDSAGFKAQGVVIAATAGSLTVTVESGTPSGTVTFAFAPGAMCEPRAPQPSDQVSIAGTRTGPGTYQLDLVAVSQPPTRAPGPTAPAKS